MEVGVWGLQVIDSSTSTSIPFECLLIREQEGELLPLSLHPTFSSLPGTLWHFEGVQ